MEVLAPLWEMIQLHQLLYNMAECKGHDWGIKVMVKVFRGRHSVGENQGKLQVGEIFWRMGKNLQAAVGWECCGGKDLNVRKPGTNSGSHTFSGHAGEWGPYMMVPRTKGLKKAVSTQHLKVSNLFIPILCLVVFNMFVVRHCLKTLHYSKWGRGRRDTAI